jgi:hypothetical protein
MTSVIEPRERTSRERAELADQQLGAIVVRLRSSGEFESVKPARWRHVASGKCVETGYSYGEGRVRIYLRGGERPDYDLKLRGEAGDDSSFDRIFPPN